jgi:hypothetical protein
MACQEILGEDFDFNIGFVSKRLFFTLCYTSCCCSHNSNGSQFRAFVEYAELRSRE